MVSIGENTFSAFAARESFAKVDDASVESVTHAIFGDKQVKSIEYLYNYDDSSDFIYIDFEDYGYAVFFKTTMELMEYSPYGSLPYDNSNEKRYYGGPANYIQKDGEKFKNIVTGETILISGLEAKNFSSQMRQAFLSNDQEKRMYDLDVAIESDRAVNAEEKQSNEIKGKSSSGLSGPGLDDDNLVPAVPPGSSGSTYIANADYFTTRPGHGINIHGTCGSVAAQLLLSYNNFYNDRRIIAPEHLNGGWNNSTGDNNMFNPANYTNRANSPNACIDPNGKTAQTLGTNNDFYNHIIGAVEPGAFTCTHTTNPDGTTNHSHNGSLTNDVRNGLRTVLGQRIATNQFTVDSHTPSLGIGSIGESGIKGEINAGRPTILLMQQRLGGSNHYVVAYGYQNYTYPGTSSSYSGYVVHFGWTGNGTTDPSGHNSSVWVNSSWVYSYISMELTHTHNYNIDTGNSINNTHRELRCEGCGHRTTADLYNISGSTITSARYPLSGSITIPSIINGTIITAIGSSAFANQTSLSILSIPNSVTNIGSNAFENCTNLIEVSLPKNLTSIGSGAFQNCNKLTEIIIPYGVTSIAENTFKNCSNLKWAHFPSSLTSIGSGAFQDCIELNNVLISTNIRSIGSGAFKNCIKLSSLLVLDGINSIGSEAFQNCIGLTNVTIPRTITTIGLNAFTGCNNLSITWDYNPALSYSNFKDYLSSVVVGSNVTSISNYAFNDCPNLTDISIYNSVTSIGYGVFWGCSRLTNITIPNSVRSIGAEAFRDCSSLTEIILPDGLQRIEDTTFGGCSSLTNIVIPDSVTYIGYGVFQLCTSLMSIVIPDGVKAINPETFFYCTSLSNVTIGSGVEYIDFNSFGNCFSITEIVIPESVRYLGGCAFYGCTNLRNVIINRDYSDITRLGEQTFYGCYPYISIYVPYYSLIYYKGAYNWSEYSSRILIDGPLPECGFEHDNDYTFTSNIDAGNYDYYVIWVVDPGTYRISFNSTSAFQIELYDDDANLVNVTLVTDPSNLSGYFDYEVNYSSYMYYLTVKFVDPLVSGTIVPTIEWIN